VKWAVLANLFTVLRSSVLGCVVADRLQAHCLSDVAFCRRTAKLVYSAATGVCHELEHEGVSCCCLQLRLGMSV
jgi:hypothetical protein